MNQTAELLLGRMIRGYRLEELLTYDDATATYRARTRELWQVPELLITVLLLPEHFSPELRSRFRDRFLQESQDLATLRHHYLLPLYGSGEQDGLLYLLGPNMPGETLADQMQQKKRWSPEEALSLLTPLATVLGYIHEQRLAYQYLQPAHIILQSSVTIQLAGLGRYSLLRQQGLQEESQPSSAYEHLKSITGAYLGAPQYIAPEVLKGAAADRRADVYSLGVLLMELLSGKPVFMEQDYTALADEHVREPLPSLRELAPELPASLELVLNRALSRNPERRFQNPAALLNAYSQMLDLRLRQPAPMPLVQQIEQMFIAPPAKEAPLQLAAPMSTRVPVSHQPPQERIEQFLPTLRTNEESARFSSASNDETLRVRRDQLVARLHQPSTENSLLLSAAGDMPGQGRRRDENVEDMGDIENVAPESAALVREEIHAKPDSYANSAISGAVDAILQIHTPFDNENKLETEPFAQEENPFERDLAPLKRSSPESIAASSYEALEKTHYPASPYEDVEKIHSPYEALEQTHYSASFYKELEKTHYPASPYEIPEEEPYHKKPSRPVKEAVTGEVVLYPVPSPAIERTEQPTTNLSLPSTQPASSQVMAMASQLNQLKMRLQAQSRATGIQRIEDNAGTGETTRQASHHV